MMRNVNEDKQKRTFMQMNHYFVKKSVKLSRRSVLLAINIKRNISIILYSFNLEVLGNLRGKILDPPNPITTLEPLSNGGLASATRNLILIWELVGSSNTKYVKQVFEKKEMIRWAEPIKHLCQIKGLNILASAGTERDIVLWDIEGTNIQNERLLRGHRGRIMCLACRDPGHLISWDVQGFIRIWGIYVDEDEEHSLNTVCLLCFNATRCNSQVAIRILNYPTIALKFSKKLKIWDVGGLGSEEDDWNLNKIITIKGLGRHYEGIKKGNICFNECSYQSLNQVITRTNCLKILDISTGEIVGTQMDLKMKYLSGMLRVCDNIIAVFGEIAGGNTLRVLDVTLGNCYLSLNLPPGLVINAIAKFN